jgi:putative transposase
MKNERLNNPAIPISVYLASKEEWAMDFMLDSLFSGRKPRTLNIVDQYKKTCLSIEAY